MKESLHRARIALLGLSIGDALGHSLMWHADRIAQRREPPTPWPWSDDTEMALSVLATLEARGTIDQDDLADRFAEGFHESRMYGPAMVHDYFPKVRAGVSWRVAAKSLFDGQGSFGNGAAMRVAPLGAWFAGDLARVAEEARLSAEVTHAHPEATAGAVAVALAAASACQLKGSPRPREPGDFIGLFLDHVPPSQVRVGLVEASKIKASEPIDRVAAKLGNGSRVSAQDSVPFAVWSAARRLDDFVDAIWSTVSVTGDMDTNAAIVGGIVASFVGEAGVPARWIGKREPLPVVASG